MPTEPLSPCDPLSAALHRQMFFHSLSLFLHLSFTLLPLCRTSRSPWASLGIFYLQRFLPSLSCNYITFFLTVPHETLLRAQSCDTFSSDSLGLVEGRGAVTIIRGVSGPVEFENDSVLFIMPPVLVARSTSRHQLLMRDVEVQNTAMCAPHGTLLGFGSVQFGWHRLSGRRCPSCYPVLRHARKK